MHLQTPYFSNVSRFSTMWKFLPEVNDTKVLIILVYLVIPPRLLD